MEEPTATGTAKIYLPNLSKRTVSNRRITAMLRASHNHAGAGDTMTRPIRFSPRHIQPATGKRMAGTALAIALPAALLGATLLALPATAANSVGSWYSDTSSNTPCATGAAGDDFVGKCATT